MTIQRRIADIAKKATGPALKRGYLAEEYDGIGGSVTIRLSTGSSSGALASVAAGAFGTEQTFPAGTIVTVVEYQGRLEVVSLGSKMAASSVTIDMLPTEGWDASTEDSPVIMPGTLPGSTLVPASLTPLQMADDIRPVAIVDVLPTLPDATYPQGSLVYNRADVPPRLYRTDDGLTWVAAVNVDDIVANSITAGQMAVGAISSQELFTKLMVANVIRTAESGARVEFGEDGIDLVDDANEVRARLPTDPTLAVYVRGTIEASTLESDSASLGGATSVLASGVLTAQAGIVKPTAAPVLTASVPSVSLSAAYGSLATYGSGVAYDSSSLTYYLNAYDNSGLNTYVLEVNPDGSLVRSVLTRAGAAPAYGIAVSATHVFVKIDNGKFRKHLKSDLSFVSEVTIGAYGSIFWDATLARIIHVYNESDGVGGYRIGWSYYTTDLILDTALGTSGHVNTTGLTIASTLLPTGGVFTGSYYWVGTNGSPSVAYPFDPSTGAYVTDQVFGQINSTDTTGTVRNGLTHNGSAFVGVTSLTMYTHTSWNWTTASAKYWVGYSWYDAGGADETELGPRASITMYRRTRLTIQHAARPAGTTSVFIYAVPNAATPSAGTFEFQASNGTSYLAAVLNTYGTASKSDETVNGFPGATAAEIRSSASPGWSLKGDGTANFDGVPLTGTDTAFSVVADGTAAYSLKSVDWVKVGRLVTFMLRFSLSANGSGSTTDISIDNDDTGLPKALAGFCVWGDRGGTGVTRIFARAVNGTNYLGFTQIRSIAAPTTNLLGVDLVNGASYTLAGSYISAS